MEDKVFEAIPLRIVAYGDRDLIVTWLGQGVGKVGTFAKGARSSKSRRWAGGIELFRRYQVVAQPRRADSLWALRESEVLEDLPKLSEQLERIGYASCVVELTRSLLRDAHPEDPLLSLVWRTLRTLQALDTPPLLALALRWFEVQALALLGHRPSLSRCAYTGHPLPLAAALGYSPWAGGVVSLADAPPDDSPWPVARAAVMGLARLLDAPDLTSVLEGALRKQADDPDSTPQLARFTRDAGALTWAMLRPLLPDGLPKSYAFTASLEPSPDAEGLG
jgi:DNA repair protein RecO (recombination protein O)